MTRTKAAEAAPAESAPADSTETPAVAPYTVETFNARLRQVALWLCDLDGYCDTAPDTVFSTFRLGRLPRRQTFNFNVDMTTTVNGETKTATRAIVAEGFTEESAFARGLVTAGFGGEAKDHMTFTPAPDPATDSDEIKALKARVTQLALDNKGNIRKSALNRSLAYLGIDELPALQRFTFTVPAEPPVLTYRVDAHTEEEARRQLAGHLEYDNSHVARGGYRERLHGSSSRNPAAFYTQAGDPVLTSSEVIG